MMLEKTNVFPTRSHRLLSAATALFCAFLPTADLHAQQFSSYFQTLPATDTLHIEVCLDADCEVAGDTIPNSLFFSVIPASFLEEIDYVADSSGSVVLGCFHFPMNDSVEAFWVETRYAWYQHHSIFLYNTRLKTFTNRVTAAEWFGGDGSQVLAGSWVFDYDGDGQKDILQRVIQHSIIPDGDDVLERNEPSAALFLFKNDRYEETALPDETTAIKLFPIKTFWE